jgi:thiosulfate/3-mercaptopyruvate sulfurtransferase
MTWHARHMSLITVSELVAALSTEHRLVIVDVRWALGRADGYQQFELGHIPGARFADLDSQLASEPSAAEGRHPLPAISQFQAVVRTLGIRSESWVVVYDQAQSFSAARLWWLLQNAGFDNVSILDRGIDAWLAAGQPVETGEPSASREGLYLSEVSLTWGKLPTIAIDEVESFAHTGVLLDARAGERFRGEVEPVDPRAGHIVGAVSAPTSDNLQPDGRFSSPAVLRERFEALGITAGTSTAVYCGSGITASHEIFALHLAGFDAALYPGSWSQWSSDPNRTIETGP